MRARGAKVTDIAVLVVAADDGVMPQTRESISHARAAEVPIVVAVNKIDLPDANTDRVKTELAAGGPPARGVGRRHAVLRRLGEAEAQNLDDLLEKVLLVADAELELKANPNAEASGPIIESRLDVGRGPVATMLVQRGTLRVGDAIVAGDALGQGARALQLPGREGQGGAAGRPGRDPRLRQAAARRRAAPASSRTSARRGTSRSCAASACAASSSRRSARRRRLAREPVRAAAGRRGPGPEPRRQGRRRRLGRGGRLRAAEDRAPRGARERHPPGRRRDHRERRHARRRVERARRRLQRAAERRGAHARRARGRRDPHLPRHLPAHRGDRAGARRHAQRRSATRRRSARPRSGRCSASRGSARSPAAWSRSGVVRRGAQVRVVRDGTRDPRDVDRAAQAVQGRRARGRRRASSAGSCSRASTTCKEGDVLEVYETREVERTDLGDGASPGG